ncbi:hypothetical protein AGOR_G00122920 [Albula goreensis]|uniref:Uncharacterized protein n=1 Tax=Albula goreensis TaxID=1534307 RepID=A0A8T3DB08_9TELE|nr:hypothetical protein AGOR_G00122920 [Albula goreensis]
MWRMQPRCDKRDAMRRGGGTSTSNLHTNFSRPPEPEEEGKLSSDAIWLWIAVIATIGNIVVVAVRSISPLSNLPDSRTDNISIAVSLFSFKRAAGKMACKGSPGVSEGTGAHRSHPPNVPASWIFAPRHMDEGPRSMPAGRTTMLAISRLGATGSGDSPQADA